MQDALAEDELPAVPGDDAPAQKATKGRAAPKPAVTDEDLDRLDAAFGLDSDDWLDEHPAPRADQTGTDG